MNSQDNYLASKVLYTKNQEDLLFSLLTNFNKTVDIINIKPIGIYSNTISPTSEKWYINATSEEQSISFITIDCGALPNTGTSMIPHGIPIVTGYKIIHFYGTATDPINLRTISLDNKKLDVIIDQTNINITTLEDLSAYTESHIIIKYIAS